MQKTLLTFIALAGCAAATATTPQAVLSTTDRSLTVSSDANTWSGISIALTLDDTFLKSWCTNDATGTYKIFDMKGSTVGNNQTPNYSNTIGLKLFRQDANSARITGTWNANGTGTIDANKYGWDNATELENQELFTNVDSASIVYLFSGGGTEATVVLTLGYTDNTTKQFNYDLTGYKCSTWKTQPDSVIDGHKDLIDGIAVYNTRLTLEQAQSIGISALDAPPPAIPEPTTATLSLLALAGLAARRRRK